MITRNNFYYSPELKVIAEMKNWKRELTVRMFHLANENKL